MSMSYSDCFVDSWLESIKDEELLLSPQFEKRKIEALKEEVDKLHQKLEKYKSFIEVINVKYAFTKVEQRSQKDTEKFFRLLKEHSHKALLAEAERFINMKVEKNSEGDIIYHFKMAVISQDLFKK